MRIWSAKHRQLCSTRSAAFGDLIKATTSETMTTTTGRNRPCPCGSGKKYKLCCMPSESTRPVWPPPGFVPTLPAEEPPVWVLLDDDPLDDLSNSVLDLIEEGNLDRAEEVCRQLLAEYPDQIDGLERTAKVAEARGDLPRAIEYHRLAADFAATNEGFDPEVERDFRARADALEARLSGEKGQPTEN